MKWNHKKEKDSSKSVGGGEAQGSIPPKEWGYTQINRSLPAEVDCRVS